MRASLVGLLFCTSASSAIGDAPTVPLPPPIVRNVRPATAATAFPEAPRALAAAPPVVAAAPAAESPEARASASLPAPTDVPVVVAPPRAPARSVCAPCRRRGPIEVRDEWLLAQHRLTLPAVSPDPLGRGAWQARIAINRGNDFGWTQTYTGELPEAGDRHFLVDGEHQTVEVALRYGLSSCVDLGVRVPIHWRGGGFMDGIIDTFHETFAWLGLMDNKRPDFLTDEFRVEGRSPDGTPFSWNDEQGGGLGNVELAAHWAAAGAAPGSPFTLAAIGRVTLPTATGPFEVGGVDVGLQVVAAWALRRRLDLYAGVGGTWFSEEQVDGVEYEPLRGSGFVALEWRAGPSWSLVLELEASSRLVSNVSLYPAFQSYLNLGAKVDLSRRWQLELGFTENLLDQQSTTDIGCWLGLVARF